MINGSSLGCRLILYILYFRSTGYSLMLLTFRSCEAWSSNSICVRVNGIYGIERELHFTAKLNALWQSSCGSRAASNDKPYFLVTIWIRKECNNRVSADDRSRDLISLVGKLGLESLNSPMMNWVSYYREASRTRRSIIQNLEFYKMMMLFIKLA